VDGKRFGRRGKTVTASHRAGSRIVPPARLGTGDAVNTALSVASTADYLAGLPLDVACMDARSLAALSLAPLVAVARADGSVHGRETHLVLTWAGEAGLRQGEAAYQLVEHWLANGPPAYLLAVWETDYVASLSRVLSAEAKHALRREISNRATALIEATGPFSGIGHLPSLEEQAVMNRIDAALS